MILVKDGNTALPNSFDTSTQTSKQTSHQNQYPNKKSNKPPNKQTPRDAKVTLTASKGDLQTPLTALRLLHAPP
jgi:hypothetical protein